MSAAASIERIALGPQAGPQTAFLESAADIAIYGGAAGGGKSYALLLEPLRHFENSRFGAVIFRRNATQIRSEGGLWHESMGLYQVLGAHPREAYLDWEFPSGMRVKFAQLEYERTVYDWQGSQIAFLGFDELTHFTEHQFFYMLSRNRSVSGVPGYVRATCNPDADSWVRRLIDWWIDSEGYPIPERSGVLRWFIRVDEKLIWSDSKEALAQTYGEETSPKSLTFIPSKIQDNRILMEKDPSYLANLRAQSYVERMRLEKGNWNIRPAAGTMFRREWFEIIDAIPANWQTAIRYWDRAATEPHPANQDPDWTRGALLFKYDDGTYVWGDLRSARLTPGQVERLIRNTAEHDGLAIAVMSQCDPGSAGVAEAEHFIKLLSGFNVRTEILTRNKITRAMGFSAQCEAGNVKVVRAPWNKEALTELESFPDGKHDDIVDALSGAFNRLSGSYSLFDAV